MTLRKSLRPVLLVTGYLLLLAWLSTPSRANAMLTDLDVYVNRCRALYPEVCVTGRFHDWRTVSIYRSHAGLHYGFDIAMDAGREVPAGWPGVVVDIVPWTATEFGVTEELAGGYRVTYGHLHPLVSVGQALQPGTFVGVVAHDHVDIKVRTATGAFFNWGRSYGVLGNGGAWAIQNNAPGLLPPPPYDPGVATITTAPLPSGPSVNIAGFIEHYQETEQRAATLSCECANLEAAVGALNHFIALESRGLPQAEQQIAAWYEAARQNQVTSAQVQAYVLDVKTRRTEVNRLQSMLADRLRALEAKRSALRGALSAASDARQNAVQGGARTADLDRAEEQARTAGRHTATFGSNADLDQKLAAARQRYAELQQSYQQGGTPQTTVDRAARECERLRVAAALFRSGDATDSWELYR